MKRFFKTAYILVLAAAFAFSSCGDLTSLTDSVVEPVETTASGKASLSVTLANGTARTILPTDVTKSDITHAELLAKASGADSFETVKDWTSDGSASAIANMAADTEILIDAGTYDFTLNLYADFNGAQTLCQTGTLLAVAVASGNNALSFATKYAAGNGSLSLTLTWTEDDRIASVKAGLFTAESGGETAVTGYELAEMTVLGDEASGFSATYEKQAPSGTYFVQFELYATDGTKINTLEDVARITTACTTSKTLVLSNVNTIYKIAYNLNGGEWTDGYTAPTSRNANQAVLLPTNANLTRTGYDFAGWYTTADFADGTAITEIALGSTADVEVWAKWTAHAYTITYELGDNATNASENPATYTIESDTITLAEPTREYCVFYAWYENAELTGDAVTEIPAGSTGDKTFYADWLVYTKGAVGHIVLADSKTVTPEDYEAKTDKYTEKSGFAVGVIAFYKESATDGVEWYNSGDAGVQAGSRENAYIIGLKQAEEKQWLERDTYWTQEAERRLVPDIVCTPSDNDDGKTIEELASTFGDVATFKGDTDGSDNHAVLFAYINSNYDQRPYINYFPAFYCADNYSSKLDTELKTPVYLKKWYAEEWYVPSLAELCYVYRNKDTINKALEKITRAVKIQDTIDSQCLYCSSSESNRITESYLGNLYYHVWYVGFYWGQIQTIQKITSPILSVLFLHKLTTD